MFPEDGKMYESAELFRDSDPNEIITGYLNLEDAFSVHNESHVVVRSANQIKSADPVTYDESGNVIPLSQRFDSTSDDTRYSQFGNAQDAEYLALAADPVKNQARLQEMVDEVARASGGIKAYHGTDRQFNAFSAEKVGSRTGEVDTESEAYFLTSNYDFAENMAKGTARLDVPFGESRIVKADGDPRVINAYVFPQNPTVSYHLPLSPKYVKLAIENAKARGHDTVFFIKHYTHTLTGNYQKVVDKSTGEIVANSMSEWMEMDKYTRPPIGNLKTIGDMTSGKDGFLVDPAWVGKVEIDPSEQYEVVAFSPNQIKSADPVTYDESGNVIPLSQRFDSTSDDTRYSQFGNAQDAEYLTLAADPVKNRGKLQAMVDEAGGWVGMAGADPRVSEDPESLWKEYETKNYGEKYSSDYMDIFETKNGGFALSMSKTYPYVEWSRSTATGRGRTAYLELLYAAKTVGGF
jgi:hypothetical protein